jgi:hypothetical protein
MNEHDSDNLQQRLQALPRERLPPAGNWQQIEARLADTPRSLSVAVERRPARSRSRRWPWMLGAAAAACLAVGVTMRPPPITSVTEPARMHESPLQLQADNLAGEYQRAMAALPQGRLPLELTPALSELDQSTQVIRSAIAQSPEAGFLLGQLQRTYALRLELTRQGLMGTAGLPT